MKLVIKDIRIREWLLKIMSVFRRVYSPVIFFILWFTSIRKKAEGKDAALRMKYNNMMSGGYRDFAASVSALKWKEEKEGGMVDFTYVYPWLCLDDGITSEWGRDCDDLAEIWFRYFYAKGWDEVYQIMCCSPDISTSHIFTVAKEIAEDSAYLIQDNTRPAFQVFAFNPEGAVKGYLKYREAAYGERYANTAWVYYKKHVNR